MASAQERSQKHDDAEGSGGCEAEGDGFRRVRLGLVRRIAGD